MSTVTNLESQLNNLSINKTYCLSKPDGTLKFLGKYIKENKDNDSFSFNSKAYSTHVQSQDVEHIVESNLTDLKLLPSYEKTYYTIDRKGKLIVLGKFIQEKHCGSYEFQHNGNKKNILHEHISHILEPIDRNENPIDKETILNYDDVYCAGL